MSRRSLTNESHLSTGKAAINSLSLNNRQLGLSPLFRCRSSSTGSKGIESNNKPCENIKLNSAASNYRRLKASASNGSGLFGGDLEGGVGTFGKGRWQKRYHNPAAERKQMFQLNLMPNGTRQSSSLHSPVNEQQIFNQKDVLGHFGCVNAVEFSPDPHEKFLASGGDDKRVFIWQSSDVILNSKPKPRAIMTNQHDSNIFCLAFNQSGDRILSSGNDHTIILHDVEGGQAVEVWPTGSTVYSLSVDPTNSNLFASASEYGRITIRDCRIGGGPVLSGNGGNEDDGECLLGECRGAVQSAYYNPIESCFIASASQASGLQLWDTRNPRTTVINYECESTATSVFDEYSGKMNGAMACHWNRTGTKLVSIRRKGAPVVHSADDPKPEAVFNHPGYYNNCTMKSCCFGGYDDQFVLSGSDDFNLHMWQLPSSYSSSRAFSDIKRLSDSDKSDHHRTCLKPKSQTVIRKYANFVLKGHRSIVNQVRYSHVNNLIVSSGVEKSVKIWSPYPLSGQKDGPNQRPMYSHSEPYGVINMQGLQGNDHGEPEELSADDVNEDSRMMAFFDSLVQNCLSEWPTSRSERYQKLNQKIQDYERLRAMDGLYSDDSDELVNETEDDDQTSDANQSTRYTDDSESSSNDEEDESDGGFFDPSSDSSSSASVHDGNAANRMPKRHRFNRLLSSRANIRNDTPSSCPEFGGDSRGFTSEDGSTEGDRRGSLSNLNDDSTAATSTSSAGNRSARRQPRAWSENSSDIDEALDNAEARMARKRRTSFRSDSQRQNVTEFIIRKRREKEQRFRARQKLINSKMTIRLPQPSSNQFENDHDDEATGSSRSVEPGSSSQSNQYAAEEECPITTDEARDRIEKARGRGSLSLGADGQPHSKASGLAIVSTSASLDKLRRMRRTSEVNDERIVMPMNHDEDIIDKSNANSSINADHLDCPADIHRNRRENDDSLTNQSKNGDSKKDDQLKSSSALFRCNRRKRDQPPSSSSSGCDESDPETVPSSISYSLGVGHKKARSDGIKRKLMDSNPVSQGAINTKKNHHETEVNITSVSNESDPIKPNCQNRSNDRKPMDDKQMAPNGDECSSNIAPVSNKNHPSSSSVSKETSPKNTSNSIRPHSSITSSSKLASSSSTKTTTTNSAPAMKMESFHQKILKDRRRSRKYRNNRREDGQNDCDDDDDNESD